MMYRQHMREGMFVLVEATLQCTQDMQQVAL